MGLEIQELQRLLRRKSDDSEVIKFIGSDPSVVERDEYYGSVVLKEDGIDFVFQEAPWVIPEMKMSNSKTLHVAAFHFHSAGHEGYNQYSGQLLGGVKFGDSEDAVMKKLGNPTRTGGGEFIHLLNKVAPRWLRYPLGDAILQLQFDARGKMDMVTLQASEV